MNNISRRNFALLELWHIKQPQTLKTPTIGDTLSSNEITSEKKKKTKTINTLPPSPPFKVRIFFVLLYSTFTCSSNSSTAMNGRGVGGGGGQVWQGKLYFPFIRLAKRQRGPTNFVADCRYNGGEKKGNLPKN